MNPYATQAHARLLDAYDWMDAASVAWDRDPHSPRTQEEFRAASEEFDNAVAIAQEFGLRPEAVFG